MEELKRLEKSLEAAIRANDTRAAIELTRQLDEEKKRFAVVCNLTDHAWHIARTYGPIAIEAAKPGQEYALTVITARSGEQTLNLDTKEKVRWDYPAVQVAEDVVREINADAGPDSYNGVFVCEGFEPKAEELQAAREKLARHYRLMLAEADQEWDRYHKPEFMSDHMRRAARYLHVERDWLYELKDESVEAQCAYCGSKLPRADVAVCATCGAILDREKAEAGGLIAGEPPQAPKDPRTSEPELAAAAPAGKRGKGKA